MPGRPVPSPRRRLYAGSLAGGAPRAAPGPFRSIARGPFAVPLEGTRPVSPAGSDIPMVIHCPLWPGGVMRPECPGLKSRKGRPS